MAHAGCTSSSYAADPWHSPRPDAGGGTTASLRPNLEAWGRLNGLRPEWIQPEKRRKVAHYDVFGAFAERLIADLAQTS